MTWSVCLWISTSKITQNAISMVAQIWNSFSKELKHRFIYILKKIWRWSAWWWFLGLLCCLTSFYHPLVCLITTEGCFFLGGGSVCLIWLILFMSLYGPAIYFVRDRIGTNLNGMRAFSVIFLPVENYLEPSLLILKCLERTMIFERKPWNTNFWHCSIVFNHFGRFA